MYANKGHGWDFLHIAVDDASRLAYTEILPSQGQAYTTAFPVRSITWFSPLGIGIERVMTDNGSAYRSKPFAKALRQAQAHHHPHPTLHPAHQWQAERFIQSSLHEWAYARPYLSSAQRSLAADQWTNQYNLVRPHAGIAGVTPWIRVNNLIGNDT